MNAGIRESVFGLVGPTGFWSWFFHGIVSDRLMSLGLDLILRL